MKKRIFVALFLIVFSIVFAGQNDILTITHYSESLHTEKTFQIYLPPDAERDERFPVLFVLHGAYGRYSDWVNRTNIEDLADHYQMILVFPDGGEFGWYVDSPIERDSQYESYVAGELVAEIDRLFPTIATREARGIMGLSMGGHGALLLAAKHPDVFGSASAMSGILKITEHPEKWHIAGRLGALEKNRKTWKANSVWDQAKRFKKANVQLLFDCGTSDTVTGAIGDSRQVHKRLVSMKAPHIWREMAGTHSWSYWQTHLEEHLNFHQAAMVKVTPNLGKWRALYFERLSEFCEENARLTLRSPKKPTVCLLGSSSMQGFPIELLKGYRVLNRGISADTLGTASRGISHRLETSVFDMNPDFVFLKNGRNDLGDRHRTGQPSIERMVEEYTRIVLTIRERLPQTRLFIVTCAPVRDKYAHLATATHSFNMQLKFLAQQHDIAVVDLYEALVDSDGLLRPEYSRDGLHLSKAGYEVWAEMMINVMTGKEHKTKAPK
jgi:S-formylglutathione hydrolase FrmB/lysophospholipase L1-like esterase